LFTPRQTALLETFANQAVIAIENVRLFKELQARNRDLTATGEILRVIASSPTDLQPVFDTIAENAWRLLRGWGALVLRFDGQLLHMAAFSGGGGRSEEERRRELRERFPAHANRETFNGAVILDGDVRQIADIETDEKWSYLRPHAKSQGWRANLGVPMLHDGQPIGVISVTRSEPGAYSPEEVELLRTFADQAVIAIENVRLFKELQEKNRALTQAHAQVTETLDQQTATADILRVISGSPTDLQPVFDAILRSGQRLLGARTTSVLRHIGNEIHLAAFTSAGEEGDAAYASLFPMSL